MPRSFDGKLGLGLVALATWLGVACTAVIQDPDGDVGPNGPGPENANAVVPEGLPCDVADFLVENCIGCHGSPPAAMVPMSLTSLADLVAPSKSNPSLSVAELSLQRMKDSQKPMPPTSVLDPVVIAPFEAWVQAGMPAGSCGNGGDGGLAVPLTCTSDQFWNTGAEESELMSPGGACIHCHANEGEGPTLLVAGTVYPTQREPDDCLGASGAVVRIQDANGKVLNLTTNGSGNFLHEDEDGPIVFPITAKVIANGNERSMKEPVPSGDCNSCHTQDGANGAPGRIYLP